MPHTTPPRSSVDGPRLLRTPCASMMQRSTWQEAADQDAAARLIERFSDQSEDAAALAAAEPGRAMLRALGGGSPFLSDLAVR